MAGSSIQPVCLSIKPPACIRGAPAPSRFWGYCRWTAKPASAVVGPFLSHGAPIQNGGAVNYRQGTAPAHRARSFRKKMAAALRSITRPRK